MEEANLSKSKRFIDEYQSVRIIVTLMVVVGHCKNLSLTLANGVVNDPYESCGLVVPVIMEEIRNLIYSFHMPLFVVLSGAVFMLTFHQKKTGEWLIGRAKRLLIPYIGCAAFLLFPVRVLTGYYSLGYDRTKVLLHDYLLGYDVNFLWYILMLMEVTILMTFLERWIFSKKRGVQFACFFGLLFASIAQFLLGGALPLQIDRTIRFAFWFYVGILVERNRSLFESNCSTRAITGASILWLTGYGIHVWLEQLIAGGMYSGGTLWLIKGFKMLVRYFMMEGGGCLFVLLLAFRIKRIGCRAAQYVGRRSFQIYLYHCPCIYLIKFVIISIVPAASMTNGLYALLLLVVILGGLLGALLLDCVVCCLFRSASQKNVRNRA